MSDRRFGIFAETLRVKVTNDVKMFDKLIKIPCQMWFKIKEKEYCYEWLDVCLSPANFDLADGIVKGDKIIVSGQMTMNEYNEKKSWSLWANEVHKERKAESEPYQAPLGDSPF
jgi:hypothetical protein